MAINFPEKYRQSLLEGFNKASETDALFTKELDMEFSGVRTVHVTNIKTEPLQDYNRTVDPSTGSRYGTTKEVGDEVQTFEMTQDKSLPLSVDKGNNKEQFNMKKAGEIMKAERDEQIIPAVDTYRLAKWAKEGGIHYELTGALTKANIVSEILALHNTMLDLGVPDQITLLISRTYLPTLKLSSEWTALDSLGGKTLAKGVIGEFDGMAVNPMTSRRMPDHVPFMLIYKGSVIAPMKIQEFKAHMDPPGLSGDLLEFRMIHDAFVLGKKANGVAVAVDNGFVQAAPTINIEGGNATVVADGSTAIYVTVDGSDPRYSKTAVAYTAPVKVEAGQTVRAYATADGKYASAVTDKKA